MKKGIKIGIGAAVVIAFVGLLAVRMMNPGDEVEVTEIPTVTLSKLEKGDMESTISLMGTIQPSDTYYIMPKVAGDLIEVYVENGQEVKQGDPIAQIDNQKQIDAAKYTLDQANASATAAQNALNRLAPLYQAGDISAQDYESTKAQADAAAAQAKSAQLNYDTQVEYSTVTAQADGVIQNLSYTLNATVSQSTQLGLLVGNGAKTINFNVTEDVMRNLEIGEEVTVDKSGVVYTGNVSEIGQVMSASNGLYAIKATLNDASGLSDGASAKITLVSKRSENADIVPLDYIYYSNGQSFVYLYVDDAVKEQEVTLGIQNNEYAEITEGLTDSDDIISSWSKELYDGAQVKIQGGEENIATETESAAN